MHQYELGAARQHGVAVGRAQRGHLVRADDDPRSRLARFAQARQRFDEGRMVAAQVGEDVFDAETGG